MFESLVRNYTWAAGIDSSAGDSPRHSISNSSPNFIRSPATVHFMCCYFINNTDLQLEQTPLAEQLLQEEKADIKGHITPKHTQYHATIAFETQINTLHCTNQTKGHNILNICYKNMKLKGQYRDDIVLQLLREKVPGQLRDTPAMFRW